MEENKKVKSDSYRIDFGNEESGISTKNLITDILNGNIFNRDFFVSQLNYIFFLTFLAILLIGNRYHAENLIRNIAKSEKELKNLQSEAIATSSELINWKNQANVYYLVKKNNLGLKPLTVQPKKLILDD